MFRTAILLLIIVVLLLGSSGLSFVSLIFGLASKHKRLINSSFALLLVSISLCAVTTLYASGRAALKVYNIGQNLWRQTHEKVAEVNQTIDETLNPTPQSNFRQITGYEWPDEAEVISTRDTYFILEGEYEIAFTAHAETLKGWLAGPAPFDVVWRTGPPLPTQIGLRSHIAGSSIGAENVWYAAHELCCDSLAWHNGSIFVIDLNTNTVWLMIWDY